MVLRVAVIGDPHFTQQKSDAGDRQHSLLKIDDRGNLIGTAKRNPWLSLQKLVNEQALKADLLICVGDLTTNNDQLPLVTGWRLLNELADSLDSKMTICATGNHDVSSRLSPQTQPALNEYLKQLTPFFPIIIKSQGNEESRTRKNSYFSEEFLKYEDDVFRLIVINTCANHNSSNTVHEIGYISSNTLDQIEDELKTSDPNKINILVCHHPPIKHGYFGDELNDFIQNCGPRLLRVLDDHGNWLVIHGHKHHGYIYRGPGGTSAPIIFSAASLSAAGLENENGYENQFYIIEIDNEQTDSLRGVIKTWNWYSGRGHTLAEPKENSIYNQCGFGCVDLLTGLAKCISEHFDSASTNEYGWDEMKAQYPSLAYLLPRDYYKVKRSLERTYKLTIEIDSHESKLKLRKLIND